MTDPDHPLLEKIDQLIALCDQMKRDNQQLVERQSGLLTERSQLVEQNELARQKIELMINRLRGLNTDQ
ncbi:MAG: TIGR02449 family protein [Porticoccaceae bacterium]